MTGFSVTKQDPYTSMRFKLGSYSGMLSDARGAFTRDINNATKLQRDARLIANGVEAETIATEYDKLQSNNYRVLSEVYKDVQALRTLDFTESEIRELLSGRRALSKKDVSMIMLGTYQPENLPNFKKDSALRNTIKNINRELGTEYTVDNFVNRFKLNEIRSKYIAIPLGLSENERDEFLRSTIERKLEDLEPKIEKQSQTIEDQLGKVQPVKPAAPFLPDPQIANMFAANIDPTSGLTQTESALLSPEEQIIAKRLRT
jgi:DNA-binding transcriptional MerR regulator